jgi:hypothetical protein
VGNSIKYTPVIYRPDSATFSLNLMSKVRILIIFSVNAAINSCHLVYDGRLVIDNDFHTNDTCIRAAGRLTKYKRAYYVDDWSHACFNQKEVGVDLAYKILKLVDPVLISNDDEDEKTDSYRVANNDPDEKVLIEQYKKPLVKYGILPGKYYYLHVTKPGLFASYEEEKSEVRHYFLFKI